MSESVIGGTNTDRGKTKGFSTMSMTLKSLVISSLICLCVSCYCHNGWISFPSIKQKNFRLSERAGAPLTLAVNAYYSHSESKHWAILWYTTGPGSPWSSRWSWDVITLLCFTESVQPECPSERTFQLQAGLCVQTQPIKWSEPLIISGPHVLKKEPFHAAYIGKSMTLTYNGEVSVHNYDPRINTMWLRFDVKARKSRSKVASIVKKLYSVLQKDENAADAIDCFKPLLDNQTK